MNREALPLILAALIPADHELGMPSAAEIDFAGYATANAAWGEVDVFLDRFAESGVAPEALNALDAKDRLEAILALRQKDLRIFSAFLTHIFRAYYSSERVQQQIGSGAVPPFPDGNLLFDDDWSELEVVFNRGYQLRCV